MPVYFWSIVVYLSFLVGFGLYLSRRVKSQEDFAVAGRSLGSFVLFGTLVATWTGTGSLFGFSERAYTSGSAILFSVFGDALAVIVLFFLAGKVRKLEQITIQDLLELRFNAVARALGAVALILAYVTIVSYQYRAAGAVLNLALPSISPEMGSFLAMLFILGFTVTAGLLSVAYTDLIQGITMIVGLGICLPLLTIEAGGVSAVATALPEGFLNPFHNFDPIYVMGIVLPGVLLILGDANMYQRFFGAKNESHAKKGVIFMLFGITFIDCAIIYSALVGRVLEPNLEIPGRVLAYAVVNHLPPFIGMIIFTAMAAIIVSTADSYLLAPSTSMVRDFYQRFIRKAASSREILIISRVFVIVLGLAAFGLSKLSDEFLSVAFYAYTIYGCAITPSLMAALFWKRATTAGAIASIAGGTAFTLYWELSGMAAKGWMILGKEAKIDTVIPAIVVSTALLIVVSFATKKQGADKLAPFGLDKS